MGGSLRDLQALRGAACLLVVLGHLGGLERTSAWAYSGVRAAERFGYAGVDIFFVLSGFIIFHAHRTKLGRPAELRPYLVKRAWRIYPTYAVCFVAVAGLFHWVFDRCYFPGYFREALWHLLLVPRPAANFVIPQAWTLSYEVMFYALFGVFFVVPRRAGAVLFAGWFAATAVCSFAVRPVGLWWMPLSPYTLEFLCGCASAFALNRYGPRGATAILGVGAAAFAVVAGLNVGGVLDTAAGPAWQRALAFGVPAVLLVHGLAARETAGRTTLPAWLRPVGDASYSIYLIHIAVLWGFQFAGAYAVTLTLAEQAAQTAAQFAAAVGVGWLVHVAVERPLLTWRRKPRLKLVEAEPTMEVRRAA
jgi:peptidoglycan/LPS O-acetylase OafA/YrhL